MLIQVHFYILANGQRSTQYHIVVFMCCLKLHTRVFTTEAEVLDLYIFSSIQGSFSVTFSETTTVVQFIRKKRKGSEGIKTVCGYVEQTRILLGKNAPGKWTMRTFL